ncbi:hypothetical protein U6G28_04600 [Actinomycetaceae bacterium MB13-C1-2]|nr:hypothetical protein U6G28_04600 [Actinomycetaceae bacterium MB13-C1-2]
MTTASTPASVINLPSASRAHRLTLGGTIRSEWIKATSLRSIRWSIFASLVLSIGLSLIMGFAMRSLFETGDDPTEVITSITAFPANFLCLVFAVLGVFMFSNEYSSGMILSTLTAAPRRGLVISAKAIVLALIAGVIALINVVVGAVIAVVLVPEARTELFTTMTVSSLAGSVLFLVGVALLSFSIAGILRNTAGAITLAVGLLFVAPMVLQILTQVTDWSWVPLVISYLPVSLGQILGYGIGSEVPQMMSEMSNTHVPGYGESLFALGMWVLVPMLVAIRLFFARDAK